MGTFIRQDRVGTSSLYLKRFLWNNRIVISMIFATITFIATMAPAFAADTIWNSGYSIVQTLLKYLKGTYCYTIFPLAVVITAITMAVTKDDKVLGRCKTALVTEIIVFFIILGIDAIVNTAVDLIGNANGFDTGTAPSGVGAAGKA